jgi:hypothetical protein
MTYRDARADRVRIVEGNFGKVIGTEGSARKLLKGKAENISSG